MNTRYFHRKANWRQTKNNIKRIRGLNGNWTDDPEEIKRMADDFFKKLYTRDTDVFPDDLLEHIQKSINDDMNTQLCKDFTDDEISDALFQIGPLKAPGPDGMPGRFFQKN
jgi:hypothetical protein